MVVDADDPLAEVEAHDTNPTLQGDLERQPMTSLVLPRFRLDFRMTRVGGVFVTGRMGMAEHRASDRDTDVPSHVAARSSGSEIESDARKPGAK